MSLSCTPRHPSLISDWLRSSAIAGDGWMGRTSGMSALAGISLMCLS